MLGLTEREYYTNSPYVNFCKAEGYYDRYDHNVQMFRNLAAITHGSLVGKDAMKIDRLWPMWYEDDNSDAIEMDDEQIKLILQAHNIFKPEIIN